LGLERVAIEVGEKSQLPEYCCHCVIPTRRTVSVDGSLATAARGRLQAGLMDEEDRAARFILRQLLGGIWKTLLLGWIVKSLSGSEGGRVQVRIPMRQCADCARQEVLEPLTVDFDYCRMRFAVHRRFAEHFQQLNRKR
jgi:hypothetical protein